MKLIPRERRKKVGRGTCGNRHHRAAPPDGLSGIGRNPPRRYLFIISASAPPGPLVNLTRRAEPSRRTSKQSLSLLKSLGERRKKNEEEISPDPAAACTLFHSFIYHCGAVYFSSPLHLLEDQLEYIRR